MTLTYLAWCVTSDFHAPRTTDFLMTVAKLIYKPHSVVDDHLSGMVVANHLVAAYPSVLAMRAASPLCLALLPVGFA